MEVSAFLKAVLEQDTAPVVICDLHHTIVYMNPTAKARYHKRGGGALVGKNLLDCHGPESVAAIERVLAWFAADRRHNQVYTFHSSRENADVYMIALRDDAGGLIGYYEKHSPRTLEAGQLYELKADAVGEMEK